MELLKQKYLTQHNTITQARYSFSATEMDIFFALLNEIREEPLPQYLYRIKVEDIEEASGRKLNSSRLQEATERLLGKVYSIEKPQGGYTQLTLFSVADYEPGSRVLQLRVSPEMESYLFELKTNYTRYYLETALRLKSKFSKRIYQMLAQYRAAGEYRTSIKKLKEQLMLIDRSGDEKYKSITLFKKNVLEVAQKELEETELPFSYRLYKKKSRSYTHIEFKIQKEAQETPPEKPKVHVPIVLPDENPNASRPLYERLQEQYRLTHPHIKAIMEQFPAKVIYKELNAIDWKISGGKVQDIRGYTIKWFQNLLIEGGK